MILNIKLCITEINENVYFTQLLFLQYFWLMLMLKNIEKVVSA